MRKLIVGLGNPGSDYEATRHNIGWMVLDERSPSIMTQRERFKGIYWEEEHGSTKISYLKPVTFMNLSGESVVQAQQFFKIDIADIIVVHDELDLPFGTLAIKKGGGLAGHNGLKSIAKLLGTQDFLRLRLGIGRPPFGNVSRWVLSPFSGDEKMNLPEFIKLANQALDAYLNLGLEKASTLFNKKTVIK